MRPQKNPDKILSFWKIWNDQLVCKAKNKQTYSHCVYFTFAGMRGSTPLDVAAASCIDNNELALALQEQDLDMVWANKKMTKKNTWKDTVDLLSHYLSWWCRWWHTWRAVDCRCVQCSCLRATLTSAGIPVVENDTWISSALLSLLMVSPLIWW